MLSRMEISSARVTGPPVDIDTRPSMWESNTYVMPSVSFKTTLTSSDKSVSEKLSSYPDAFCEMPGVRGSATLVIRLSPAYFAAIDPVFSVGFETGRTPIGATGDRSAFESLAISSGGSIKGFSSKAAHPETLTDTNPSRAKTFQPNINASPVATQTPIGCLQNLSSAPAGSTSFVISSLGWHFESINEMTIA